MKRTRIEGFTVRVSKMGYMSPIKCCSLNAAWSGQILKYCSYMPSMKWTEWLRWKLDLQNEPFRGE